MRKRIVNLNTRGRIVVSSFLLLILFFILTTPLTFWISSILTPPEEPFNINAIQNNQSITLTWTPGNEIDIRKHVIEIQDNSIDINNSESRYVFETTEYPVSIKIYAVDVLGFSSEAVNFELQAPPQNFSITNTFNQDNESVAGTSVALRSILTFVVILLLTAFVFKFKLTNFKQKILLFYPSIVLIPYVILSISFLVSETTEFSRFVLSALFSVVFYIVTYFVLLTTNILYTSTYVTIPLEQAARAAQFIFSLLSSYLVLILFFGASFNFFQKSILILPFIFYLSYSSILLLAEVKSFDATIKALTISLTIWISIFIFSIWPINYIFAILAVAVCFYILLSMSLEVRSNLNRYVWAEYGVLILLILILLIISSNWGINGTLI